MSQTITGPRAGAAILSSQLGVQWNFYLFAVPGVLGAVLAVLVPMVRASRVHGQAAQPDFV